MHEDIMDRILEELDKTEDISTEDSIGVGESHYFPVRVSKDNFQQIEEGLPPSQDCRIIFIDGGNAEIFRSPDKCVHFIRVFHTVYKENKRISCNSDEFYVFSHAKNQDNTLLYAVKLFREKASTLTDSFFSESFMFDSFDPMLRDGSSRLDISRTPGMIRRFAELSTALLLAGSAGKGDIIVIDGDLRSRIPDEKKLIKALHTVADKNKVIVCALSKTSTMLTSRAASAVSALKSIAPPGSWFYYPAAAPASNSADVYFTRLHNASDYVFKFEMFGSDDDPSVFALLSANSKDPVFLGYPYGLVEADRFARISNSEANYLRTAFMAKAGKGWEEIDSAEKALDAHSVLDNIG
jgi:hypothetical protein